MRFALTIQPVLFALFPLFLDLGEHLSSECTVSTEATTATFGDRTARRAASVSNRPAERY